MAKKRGTPFGEMPPDKRLAAARRGGKKVQALGLAHHITAGDEAREMGRRGGKKRAESSRGVSDARARRVRVPSPREAKARDVAIVAARSAGLSLAALAEVFGLSTTAIIAVLRQHYVQDV